MKRVLVAVTILMVLAIGVQVLADPVIGFLYSGPIGDYGWTYTHDQARQALPYETRYVENVTPDNIVPTTETLISEGCTMIFATSWEQLDFLQEIAPDHLDVSFFCARIEGEPSANVWLFLGRMYQARYLSGVTAGRKSKTGKIGYVAALPIPEVIRGINAFTLGVRSVNPDAEVIVRWTYSWYDPTAEVEAAQSLIADGVDLLAQHVQGPSVQQVAEDNGVMCIGYNLNMSAFAPTMNVDNCVWRWEPLYRWLIFEALSGAKGSVMWADVSTGTASVTSGPGVVPDLEWTDAQLMGMDWYVDGVAAP